MSEILDAYRTLLGSAVIDQLQQTANPLKGLKVVHVNSTKEGGGVAEILTKMVPLSTAVGVESRWETIKGTEDFFQCTKLIHNLLQGMGGSLPNQKLLNSYIKTNAENAEALRPILQDADIVTIHDPQPLPLIDYFPNRKGKWIWRSHIDLSSTHRQLWKYLSQFIAKYDASIFSLEDFVRPLPHPIYLIPPSIDPLSEKNIEIDRTEVIETYKSFKIDPERPTILQVSRFDRFKDPIGVIQAYFLAKKFFPSLQLILAGGGASDDPEGMEVLNEVKAAINGDPDIHVLFLPPAPRTVNCLQRGADIILQKSLKEGFGLTVTEALWKSKPVIGGKTGGIRLQVFDHYTGFLVTTPEGAALRIRYLLQNPQLRAQFGKEGKQLVQDNFLITRQVREKLTVFASLLFPKGDRIDFTK